MKIKIFSNYIVTIAIAMLFVSCAKDGSTGPIGPTGATGATGNANVATDTFSITSASWIADSVDLQWGVLYPLPSALNVNGAVLLYVQDSISWAALPHVDYGMTLEYEFDPNAKVLNIQAADAKAEIMIGNPGAMTFKVVVIPPAARLANVSINFKNYSEVKRTFNLSN